MRSTTTITVPGEFIPSAKYTYQVSLNDKTVSSTSGHAAPRTYGSEAEAINEYVKLALARPSNSDFPHRDMVTRLEPTDDQGRSLGELSMQAMRELR